MSLANVNLKNESLSDQIFNILKKQIIDGEFEPGKRLVIDRIADQIGVSSTPVRDALRMLISAGYAERKANDGIFVIELSKNDIVELYDLREVMEGLAVRLLTKKIEKDEISVSNFENLKKEFGELKKQLLSGEKHISHELDIKFHDFIEELVPNNRLKKQIELIMNQTYHIRNMQHKNKVNENLKNRTNKRLLKETEEHIMILKRIIEGDFEEAENTMRTHIRNSKQDILKKLKYK